MKRATILAAVDNNMGIAKAGAMAWRCPEDLRRFRERTLGNVVVMGRKTFQTLPRGLPGRDVVVLTCDPASLPQGVVTASNWSFLQSEEYALRDVFVIGGHQVYDSAFEEDLVDKIVLTQIPDSFGCDLFFPYRHVTSDRWGATKAPRMIATWQNGQAVCEFQIEKRP